jgi:hypothetical protein
VIDLSLSFDLIRKEKGMQSQNKIKKGITNRENILIFISKIDILMKDSKIIIAYVN